MKFRGIFCATTAANNEEYRKVLKRRNIWLAAVAGAGALVALAALLAERRSDTGLPDYILGVYCGFVQG